MAVAPGARFWLVEPWFAAPGHPAQTLRSTADALSGVPGLTCLVPRGAPHLDSVIASITAHAMVMRYRTPSQWLPLATVFGLLALRDQTRRDDIVLFLDAHLVALAALWGLLGPRIAPHRVGVLYLGGPERIAGNAPAMAAVRRFVERPFVRLLLRTDELAGAWAAALPPAVRGNVGTLPTLEIPTAEERVPPRPPGGLSRFLVVGQIRTGKGLERLVPLFRSRPDLGTLTVAGAFASDAMRAALPELKGFAGLREGYLVEADLLAKVADHDYLLMLYEGWDHRMEAATLFLAARVGRPVVVFDAGWCGRMLRTYGCGVAIPIGVVELGAAIQAMPAPGSPEYAAMIDGMARFRDAHLPDRLRPRFLSTMSS